MCNPRKSALLKDGSKGDKIDTAIPISTAPAATILPILIFSE
jgi:hypothetical protein